MKFTKLMMVAAVIGLLSLNACMLTMGGDEGMGMHEGMPMYGGMMHSADDEGDSSMNHEKHDD